VPAYAEKWNGVLRAFKNRNQSGMGPFLNTQTFIISTQCCRTEWWTLLDFTCNCGFVLLGGKTFQRKNRISQK